MKKFFLMTFSLFCIVLMVNAQQRISLKMISDGAFAAETVSGIMPINDTDQYACISKDGTQVVQYSFKTGKPTAVLFDVNKTIGDKIANFDGFSFSPDGTKLLIQTKTQRIYRRSFTAHYYIYTIANTKLEPLSGGGAQQTPVWSADSKQIAFVRNNNIFLVRLLYDNAETQITKDGKPNEIINGLPDWVNEEEFSTNRSMCFNADGTKVCWIKYDESKVKTFQLQFFKGTNPALNEYQNYPGLYEYKYPKAGEDNAKVSVWSYDIKSRQVRELKVPVSSDGYIPRIKPTNDANKVIVYTMNRHQDELCLYGVNPSSTISTLLIKESVPKYVREELMEGIIISNTSILLPSDRDGFTKGYLYTLNGQLIRTIEHGNTEITKFYGIDEQTGDVYYQAAAINAHDRQVFVAHKNGKTDRLTSQEGWNTAIFSADFKYFINTWSDYNNPFVYTICDNRGKTLTTLVDNKTLKQKVESFGFTPKETFQFTTTDGVVLDGWMIKPANFSVSKQYPVIMFQYSGPGSQQVINSWNAGSMGQGGVFDYYLAQQGFIVVCVDGRGTGGRGAVFEKSVYLQLGKLEANDQVEAALWLSQQTFVDKDRIGIWGWSFGGFNTLMSMSEGRPVFRAGVAVAPPTHWKYYDTVYTERYMRTPKENPDGYNDNPIERARKLHGALLICQGLADDNVHAQNVFEYSEALVQADKDFKELIYTNRNHSIYGGNTRNHLMRQIANFFINEMK